MTSEAQLTQPNLPLLYLNETVNIESFVKLYSNVVMDGNLSDRVTKLLWRHTFVHTFTFGGMFILINHVLSSNVKI